MPFSDETFAEFGVGAFAFIRQCNAERLSAIYPQYRQVHGLRSDLVVYVIHEADGTPIRLYSDPLEMLEDAAEWGSSCCRCTDEEKRSKKDVKNGTIKFYKRCQGLWLHHA